ncbi:DUF1559 domain-containing protein [Singulisphaera sp. PoT]|uniref:DUF1559 family PulG-like putative transporter n=1 Tax=Singulisphaera sp. PoT TaxID=3411797 RepID=UPI003BF5D559
MRRVVSTSGSRVASAVAFYWLLTWAGALPALGDDIPKKAPGSASLARYFPKADLVAYLEFEGLDAHADAWRKTSVYKILNETTTGPMLRSLAVRSIDRLAGPSRSKSLNGAEVLAFVEHAFRNGFAFGFSGRAGSSRPACVGFVARNGARAAVRPILERMIDSANGAYAVVPQKVEKPGPRQVMQVSDRDGMGHAWWIEGEDMVFSILSPQGADDMIDALIGKRPSAVDHPVRTALAADQARFVPIGWSFFDVTSVPTWSPKATSLGLDTIRRVESSWGFDGEALMSRFRIVAPAPRVGALALFDQPGFDLKGLPPLVRGLDGFAVASLSPAKMLDILGEQVESLNANPNAANPIVSISEAVRKITGHKLKEEILAPLGPKFVFGVLPSKVGAPTNAFSGLLMGVTSVPRATLLIELKDPSAYARILEDVVKGVNEAFRLPADAPEGDWPKVRIEPLAGDVKGYVASVAASLVPLPAGVRPTLAFGKNSLVIAASPEVAKAALKFEEQPAGLPAESPLARDFGARLKSLTMLGVRDDRTSSLAEMVANLPVASQWVDLRRFTGAFAPNAPFQMMMGGRVAVRRRPLTPDRSTNVSVDPRLIPSPDDLRPFLFPSWYALSVDDKGVEFLSREAFPAFNPATVWPIALAVVLPARHASRAETYRTQSVTNLKRIGLAFHNFHAATEAFPASATRDKDGKPLLSWRVAILPYLEQAELYNQFHLDEPWDSPHNKPLLQRMPKTYELPGARAQAGMTFYRTFAGSHSVFDPSSGTGTTIAQVTDGTSGTVAVVEARDAVPWTKPDAELEVDAENVNNFIASRPVSQLGGHFPGGFNMLLLDGSVRFVKETINVNTLRSLITKDLGEVISNDAY